MATLEELRRMVSRAPGTPEPLSRVERMKVALERVRKARGKGTTFKISDDGKDALLLFGRFSGSTVSRLAADPVGRKYLLHIMRLAPLTPELRDVINFNTKKKTKI